MTATRSLRRRTVRGRRRSRVALVVIAVALVAGALATVAVVYEAEAAAPVADPIAPASDETVTPTHTPVPTPPTAEERLLATASDPRACAVSFAGEGIAIAPQLQTQGTLYAALPIPRVDGRVFAGWYASEGEAAARTIPSRVNGSRLVTCTDRRATLHAAWTTAAANQAENARIPILMYHQFTTKPEGESNWLRLNYTYIGDFDAQMGHIQDGGFYLPTWDELDAFIDGALFLPAHSVIISDDDADPTWIDLAAPVVARRGLLTTSFVITSARSAPSPNPFVLQRSHTHDMHRAGANGKGRMVNEPVDVVAADLERSAQILGAKEVVAYPYGHYNDTAKQAMRQAGFALGRTTEHGYVRIGTDKLALPVIRVDYGMSVTALARAIG